MSNPLQIARRVGGGTATVIDRPLHVWLVVFEPEGHAEFRAFADFQANETEQLRRDIQGQLQTWFDGMLQLPEARPNRPIGVADQVVVEWATDWQRFTADARSLVSDYDIVVYFSMSQLVPAWQARTSDLSQTGGPSVRDQSYLPSLSRTDPGVIMRPSFPTLGGATTPWARLPVLSEVYVMRYHNLAENAWDLAVSAFHEATHNKTGMDNRCMHRLGGMLGPDGISCTQLTEATLNANLRTMAASIWTPVEQYLPGMAVGRSDSPGRPPLPTTCPQDVMLERGTRARRRND